MGFQTKHRERDIEIPKHRQKLINTILNDLINDDNVLAVFLRRSLGNKNTDIHSDIDLHVVVKDDVFEEYRLNKS